VETEATNCGHHDFPVERLRAFAPACGFAPHALARKLGVSLRQLQRLFVLHMRCSPSEWLREERLQHALALLRTAPHVKAVVYELGFKHPSQFARDFRARFGVAPSALLSSNAARLGLRGALYQQHAQRHGEEDACTSETGHSWIG
jgi:AraC-like DNA-binding protein